MRSTEPQQHLGIPYPRGRLIRWAYQSPILLYRLGLRRLVGKLFLVLTTTGRHSGLPRHTAIEYHAYAGRKYVVSAWGAQAQWYKNILADPRVTVQAADGTFSMRARRVTSDEELAAAFRVLESNPIMQRWVQALGFNLTLEDFLANRDRFYLITFDPTDEVTPPAVRADLVWVWAALFGLIAAAVLLVIVL